MAPPSPTPTRDISPGLARSLARLALRVAILVIVAYAAQALVLHAMRLTEALPAASRGTAQMSVLLLALILYAILIAIPFVPGVEIGVALLILRGAEVAPFVYLATLTGLTLAYTAGRILPHGWLQSTFADLRMHRASALLDRLSELGPERRLALLRSRLPTWLGPHVVRLRYLLLALALNLPGNALLGGGGGLSLLAGFSRLYRPAGTFVTLALATAPIPLLVWAVGPEVLSRN
ncbi:hypothetical protein PVW48_01915 [Dinoroseobacter sp. PD6]|uniref:hypothetical protein n=1 Tax=Dinoroseobacter sp. PD6 TaxID=3028384 RepID=UPI00237A8231|nr:hypothetical protein [Dinoroseobacter sp. PD6]MDD9715485.1 hypothetical protein [Dinoroseobacter sp. PD6]